MKLKFIGTSVILERKHENYAPRRVKAHFFESPNGQNVVIKSYSEEFHKLTKAKPIVMNLDNFNKLPREPEAKAAHVLKLMGWE